MTTSEPSSLDLRRLSVTVDQQQRLRDIDMNVLPGELFFVIGRQGAGKSTLLRTIAGLDPVDSGEVYIDAREVTDLAAAKRGVAMLLQSYPLWPHLDVNSNIVFALKGRGVAKAERKRLTEHELNAMGLGEFAKHFPAQLNASQRQRIALARTLVAGAKINLLDEPFSAQDLRLRERLLQGLRRRLQQSGTTTLISSEDPHEAMRFADRIAILHDGELLQIGSPQELYDNPVNRQVAEYLGDVNLIDGEIEYAGDQPLFHANNGIIIPVFERALKRARTSSAMFRPHDLRIVNADDEPFGDRIRLTGRVEQSEFRGSQVSFAIDLAGETIWIDLPRRRDKAGLQIGDQVVLSIDPARILILDR